VIWYTNQSLLLIALSFLLGLLVGYLWWGLRLRRVRTAESTTETASAAVAPVMAPAFAVPVAAEPEPAEIEPASAKTDADPAESSLAGSSLAEPALAEPAPAEPALEPAAFGAEALPGETTTVDDADDALVADVESAFADVPADAPSDDLARIEGIGPKIAAALQAAGITTFAALADADRSTVEDALADANLRFAPSLSTWSQQARLLADGDEQGFKVLTDRLIAGREVTAKTAPELASEPETLVDTVPETLVDTEPETLADADAEFASEPEPETLANVVPVADVAPEPETLVNETAVDEPVVDEAPAVVVPAQAVAVEDGPADDLKRIEGIGPKMSAALIASGIRTFGQLAATDVDTLRAAIEAAGLRFAPSIVTWARQAQLLADGDEAGFADLTRRLVAGRDTGRA
jgi:predicted flap endonuclease-1-like 5' DNA nuclease